MRIFSLLQPWPLTPRLWVSAALAILVFLSACGGPTVSQTPLTVTDDPSANQRVVQHAFGETRIPRDPQRIIALGEEGLLVDLLEIDVRPLIASVNLPETVAGVSGAELEGIELFASANQPSLESFAVLQPDLIIGTQFFIQEIGYDNLSRIAPTVAIGMNGPRESYRETLRLFGLEEQANAEIAAFEQSVVSARERLQQRSPQVSLATVYPGASLAVWVDGPTSPPLLLRELGVTLIPDAEAVSGVRNGRAFLSNEQLNLLAGERIILLQSDSVEGESAALAEMQAMPLWAALPAAQSDQVFVLDRLGYPGMRGLEALLSDLVSLLEPAN